MALASLLNTVWMAKGAPEAWAFHRATHRVALEQKQILTSILHANQATTFGTRHNFQSITSPREYQERVPLSTYEDYARQRIRQIKAGATAVLTSEPVRLLQPTSGTTGGEKLIPYTASLRRQFQRALAAWITDLFWHRPAVRSGRAYWSISPALGAPRRTRGGIPIGFDDDAAYLGGPERWALNRLLVAPAAIARIPDLEAFRYATLLHLLRAEDLALISVWNPTFLTALLGSLEGWQDRLCADLRNGTMNLTRDAARPDVRRAAAVESILRSGGSWAEKLRAAWPRLALISCWTDAAAGLFLPELREWFPTVEIQPKGLLATEGCVSFPLTDRPGAVLAIRSHFFEFTAAGSVKLAHELERGGRYGVVLTTGGGLYRYQIHDEVEVVGFEKQCPLLRFLGKLDRVSDLVGEKLAEVHVRTVLDRVFAAHCLAPRFALLAPARGHPVRYCLYLQGSGLPSGATLQAELQAGLEENPYYRHAVGLGQLAPVEIEILKPDGEPGYCTYERRCLVDGQKAGDIKPTALDSRFGWAEDFHAASQLR